MDQRTQFIADYHRELFTVVELADRFNLSRKTAYEWMDRYDVGGPAGLVDLSRRPKRCPHETPEKIVDAPLELRRHHPTWGPKQLRRVLSKRQPNIAWPAHSTVAALLQRRGMITPPRRRPTLADAGASGVCRQTGGVINMHALSNSRAAVHGALSPHRRRP